MCAVCGVRCAVCGVRCAVSVVRGVCVRAWYVRRGAVYQRDGIFLEFQYIGYSRQVNKNSSLNRLRNYYKREYNYNGPCVFRILRPNDYSIFLDSWTSFTLPQLHHKRNRPALGILLHNTEALQLSFVKRPLVFFGAIMRCAYYAITRGETTGPRWSLLLKVV